MRNQKYYNRKAREKKLEIGDLALLLLPTDHNKLLLHWKRRFKVVGRVGAVDRIELPSGKIKTFHANMLKKYYLRTDDERDVSNDNNVAAAVACVVNDDTEDEEEEVTEVRERGQMQLYNTVQKETVDDVNIISPDC